MNEELLKSLYEKSGLSDKISIEQFANDLQDNNTLQAVISKLGLDSQISLEQVRTDLGFNSTTTENNTPTEGITDPSTLEDKRPKGFFGNIGSAIETGARDAFSNMAKFSEAVGFGGYGSYETTLAHDRRMAENALRRKLRQDPDNKELQDRVNSIANDNSTPYMKVMSGTTLYGNTDNRYNEVNKSLNSGEEETKEQLIKRDELERPLAKGLREGFDKDTKKLQATQNYAGQGVTETLEKDGWLAFIEKGIATAMESAPNMAITVLNAPAGIGIMGTSSFAGKYDELREKGIDKNTALATGAVVGLAEAALESLGGAIAKKSIKSLFGKEALEKTLKSKLIENPITAALFEGTGELGVQFIDNLASHLAGANGDKELTLEIITQGLLDAFIVGSGTGAAIATPGAIARGIRGNQDVVASGSQSLPGDQDTDPPSGAQQGGEGGSPPISLGQTAINYQDDNNQGIQLDVNSDGVYTLTNNGGVVGTGNLTELELDGLENVKRGRQKAGEFKKGVARRLVSENTPDIAVQASSLVDKDGNLNKEGERILERNRLGEDVFIENDTDFKNNDISEITGIINNRIFNAGNTQSEKAVLEGNRVVFNPKNNSKDPWGAEYNKDKDGNWFKTSYKTNKTSKKPVQSAEVLERINKKVNKRAPDSDSRLESINRFINAQEQATQAQTQGLQGQPSVQGTAGPVSQANAETEITQPTVGENTAEQVTEITQPTVGKNTAEQVIELNIPSYNTPIKRNLQTGLWHRVKGNGELYSTPIKDKGKLQEIETELQNSNNDGQIQGVPNSQATKTTTEPTGAVDGSVNRTTSQDGQSATLQEEVSVGDGEGTVRVPEQVNEEVGSDSIKYTSQEELSLYNLSEGWNRENRSRRYGDPKSEEQIRIEEEITNIENTAKKRGEKRETENVMALFFDEATSVDLKADFPKEWADDPRKAAIAGNIDMIKFLKGELEYKSTKLSDPEGSIKRREREIKILEKSIANQSKKEFIKEYSNKPGFNLGIKKNPNQAGSNPTSSSVDSKNASNQSEIEGINNTKAPAADKGSTDNKLQPTAQDINEQAKQLDDLGFGDKNKKEKDGSSKVAKALAYVANRLLGLKGKTFAEAVPLVGKVNVNRAKKIAKDSKSKLKYLIIGETGAVNLEGAETVMQNLSVAREMEAVGKDAKTIRLATAWEKGKDGKWRYEIDDIELIGDLSPFQDGFTGEGYIVPLGDFVRGEFLDLYPELKDITVVRGLPSNAGFGTQAMVSGNDIYLSDRIFNGDTDYGKSVLLHEIQHLIQKEEGFTRGGNPEFLPSQITRISENWDRLSNKIQGFWGGLDRKTERRRIKDLFRENNISAIPQWITLQKTDIEKIEDTIDQLEILNKEYPNQLFKEAIKELDNLTNILDFQTGKNNRYEVYKRIVGEVEARNVQTRLNLTPQQRKEQTLQETEDVAREDQIVLEAVLGSEASSNTKFSAENQTPQTEADMVRQIKEVVSGARAALNAVNSQLAKTTDSAQRKSLLDQKKKIQNIILEHSSDAKIKKKYSRELNSDNKLTEINSEIDDISAKLETLENASDKLPLLQRRLELAREGRKREKEIKAEAKERLNEGLKEKIKELETKIKFFEKPNEKGFIDDSSGDSLFRALLNIEVNGKGIFDYFNKPGKSYEIGRVFGGALKGLSKQYEIIIENNYKSEERVNQAEKQFFEDVRSGVLNLIQNELNIQQGVVDLYTKQFKEKVNAKRIAEAQENVNNLIDLKEYVEGNLLSLSDLTVDDAFGQILFSKDDGSQYYAAVVQGLESDILLSLAEAPGPTAFIHEVAGHVMERFYTPAQKQFVTDQYNKWAKENKQPQVRKFDDTANVGDLKNEPVVSEWLARVVEEYYKAGRDLNKVDAAKGMNAADKNLLQQALDTISEAIQAISEGIKKYLGSEVKLTKEMQQFFDKEIIGPDTRKSNNINNKTPNQSESNQTPSSVDSKNASNQSKTKSQAEVDNDINTLESFGEIETKNCK